VVAFYFLFLVTTSFYVKQWIGQSAWRAIHMMSFGIFVTAGLHGVFSGTDTSHPVVMGMYFGSLAIVVMLLIIRIAQASSPERPARSPARRPVRAEKPAAVNPSEQATVELPAQG
jgi:DMSO/TMAO reductase YedYZ heme-binding membrane subunit